MKKTTLSLLDIKLIIWIYKYFYFSNDFLRILFIKNWIIILFFIFYFSLILIIILLLFYLFNFFYYFFLTNIYRKYENFLFFREFKFISYFFH